MFDPKNVSRLNVPRWEAVYRCEVLPGVTSVIAIHDISRGWALGGCRMARYDNEALAMTDCLRLSRGMTFKNAAADLPLGGGKSIIVCNPEIDGSDRQAVLEEFGKFVAWVNSESDRYYTAEDMNTTVADMHVVKTQTKNIYGITVDPSPYTAWGVFSSVKYAVDYFAMDLFEGHRELEEKSVLIQGLGKVGRTLCDYMHDAGMKIFVSDVRDEALDQVTGTYKDVEAVHPNQVYKIPVDVFAPCAKGEVVHKRNIDDLKFKMICGAANNQLQNSNIGNKVQAKGIVYCPDYIANMGGVCSIQYLEIEQLGEDQTLNNIERTVRKMLGLTFRAAFRNNLSFNKAVDHVVKQIVWGKPIHNTSFSNHKLFPFTQTAEPH